MLAELSRLATRLDPSLLLDDLGFQADPWQRAVLRSTADRLLLLCARQAGKSTASAALALHTALSEPGALILVVSPSLRQSSELYRKIAGFYADLGRPIPAVQDSAVSLALANGSRVVSLPGSPATVRGFSGPRVIVADEAALIADEMFAAILPMLAVSRGRLVCLSTPMGARGFFHDQWENGGPAWERHKATAYDCPRVGREWLQEQRAILGDRWWSQEFLCEFVEALGQVFPTDAVLAAFVSDRTPLFGPPAPAAAGLVGASGKAPLFTPGG
jgi:hypothetical protein